MIDAAEAAADDQEMPRFVLLLHHCPDGRPRPTHFDLMLEAEGNLQTWALAWLPQAWQGLDVEAEHFADSNRVAAERLADHRLDYLTWEGPVSGDRGRVRRLDEGTYRAVATPGHFAVEGKVVRGDIEITPPAGSDTIGNLSYRAASSTGNV